MKQANLPAFAASRAATLCPPAGALKTANDVSALVARPDTSGQRVGSLREARIDACYSALFRSGRLGVDRFAVVSHMSRGPVVDFFCVRSFLSSGAVNRRVSRTVFRIRGAV